MATLHYAGYGHLAKTTRPVSGSFTRLFYLPIETASSVTYDLATGTVTGVVLKTGAPGWYAAAFVNARREYREDQKESEAGPYVESSAQGFLPAEGTAAERTIDWLKYGSFLVLVQRPSGVVKLLGSVDRGAEFSASYGTGDSTRDSPGSLARFAWQSEDKPLVYSGSLAALLLAPL